jgi:putative methyltransferase (TIGR04325 family)
LLNDLAKLPVQTAFQFARACRGRFRGVFHTYEAAEAAIPKNKLVGYNHSEISKSYLHTMSKARDTDYPVIFWLGQALREGHSVFDYGGNIGVSYYKFSHYLDYPSGLQWCICDLPEIVRAGETLAQERDSPLSFTTQFEVADGTDILLASGAIQYIPKPFAQSLAELRKKPKHILINRLPLYDGSSFVTLDPVGQALCAYQVFNRQQFVDSICGLGYDLKDWWSNPDWSCNIRWHARHSFSAHSGLYFCAK